MIDNDSYFYKEPKLLKEVLNDIKNSEISVQSKIISREKFRDLFF